MARSTNGRRAPSLLAAFSALLMRRAAALSAISTAPLGSETHRLGMQAQLAVALAQQRAGRSSPVPPRSREVNASNCAQGKLLPEFYVLGAKNTATSSLWDDLARTSHVMAAPGTFEVKEWQFFQKSTVLPDWLQQPLWLSSMPDCPQDQKATMADFSVTNLFCTPLPPDLAWSEEFGYPARETLDYTNFDTARRIRKFHAEAGVPVPRLVVMLREPLARVQSEYYHTLPLKNCNGCQANASFVDSFATNVGLLLRHPPEISDWFWKSFYSRQVEEYLKYFDAKQFYFAPDKEYFEDDPTSFSTSLMEWLGLEGQPWTEASHANEHTDKPPLDEELPPAEPSRKAYEAFMAPENERLVRTLTEAHKQGAQLSGYEGAVGDTAAVRKWLQRHW